MSDGEYIRIDQNQIAVLPSGRACRREKQHGYPSGADNQSGGAAASIVAASAPEPSTWATMLIGFGGLGFLGYRSSRKAASIAT
jgi:hypothetical protein